MEILRHFYLSSEGNCTLDIFCPLAVFFEGTKYTNVYFVEEEMEIYIGVLYFEIFTLVEKKGG